MQGKTLSLLTASLTWLSDHQDRARKAHALEVTGNAKKSTPQWAIDQAVARKKRELEAREEEREERMKKARAKEAKLRAKVVHMKKKQVSGSTEGWGIVPNDDIRKWKERRAARPSRRSTRRGICHQTMKTQRMKMGCRRKYGRCLPSTYWYLFPLEAC